MENKKTYEELKEELDRLLKEGKIDKYFYNKEIEILNTKIIKRAEREKDIKKQNNKNKISNIVVILIFIVTFFSLFFLIGGQGILYGNKYELVNSFDSLPVPISKKLRTPKTEKIIVDGEEFKVKLIYEYTVYGRVVGTLDYDSKTVHGSVVPKDVGLVFGPLAQNRFLQHLKFESKYIKSVGRVLYYRIKTAEGERILTNMGFGSYLTNNHILGCDERVDDLIDKISVGNYIKLQGYLCEILGSYDQRVSSTQTQKEEYVVIDSDYEGRNNNDCETIFVTDVKWLRER